MAITAAKLVSMHPLLYHMSAQGNLPSIARHGLLSTTALLNLFEYEGEQRYKIESCRRSEGVRLSHPARGDARIRDQWPLCENGLRKALPRDMEPKDWYRILNDMVFFFPSRERLKRMLWVYRKYRSTVLAVNTDSLLKANGQNVYWSPINSGYTIKYQAYRDRHTFVRLGSEPRSRRGRSRGDIVEIAVKHSVPDITKHVKCAVEVGAGMPPKNIWPEPSEFSRSFAAEIL